MKIFAISDLHLDINNTKPMDIFGPVWHDYLDKIKTNWLKKVTDEDIVILAGDFSWAMKLEEVEPDFKLLNELPGYKILIRGNHDYWWSSLAKVRAILPKKTYALQNDAVKIGDYIFCGNRGWNFPEGKYDNDESKKIYARELIRTEMSLIAAKKLQTDNEKIIFVTHYPPFNNRAESTDMTELIETFNVDYIVYGHLHGKFNPIMKYIERKDIKYFLTSCDSLDNELIEIK